MEIGRLFPRTRASGGQHPAAAAAQAMSAVRTLNQEFIAAARVNDVGWFRDQLAADAVIVLGDGRRLRPTEFLAMLEEQPRKYRTLDLRDVNLRAYGSTVQVDADAPWEMADGTTGVSRYIDTWIWLDGRWRVISAQVTVLPRDADQRG